MTSSRVKPRGHRRTARFFSSGLTMTHQSSRRASFTSRSVVAGFKIDHVSAAEDTLNTRVEDFLPAWMWEIADRFDLVITLDMVCGRAIADPDNGRAFRECCRRYSNARVVLAHGACAFGTALTVEAIDSLRGLDNVFFDTSANCEPGAFQVILRVFGTRRLLYGSDFPVSNYRGRGTSLGDSFFCTQAYNVRSDADPHRTATLVGIESILALQYACRLAHLGDTDVERIFVENARRELGLIEPPSKGQELYIRAKQIIPGGTQLLAKRPEMFAPDRWPAYYSEARGVEVTDSDGRRFTDMSILGIGACLLGFSDPDVNAAVSRRVALGSTSSLNCVEEVELAEVLLELHPWAERVRYGRTGGETVAIAVRIARAATGREKVAVCGYHGWSDWYIAANLGANGVDDQLGGHLLPGLDPAGVPASLGGTVETFSYNRLDQIERIATENDLAAIVMEPTRGQHPDPGFLEGVRALAEKNGATLIFDEISVGWRLALGGAHLRYGVSPDMAVFSKATGNGFPIAAIVGRGDVMDAAQSSFISSTMWTEAIGPTAALATIAKMREHDVPAHVRRIGTRYRDGMASLAESNGLTLVTAGHPAITTMRFQHDDAAALQTLLTTRMLDRGFLLGSGFYPCLAHETWHVDRCLEAASEVFSELAEAAEKSDAETRLGSPVKHTGFRRLA